MKAKVFNSPTSSTPCQRQVFYPMCLSTAAGQQPRRLKWELSKTFCTLTDVSVIDSCRIFCLRHQSAAYFNAVKWAWALCKTCSDSSKPRGEDIEGVMRDPNYISNYNACSPFVGDPLPPPCTHPLGFPV